MNSGVAVPAELPLQVSLDGRTLSWIEAALTDALGLGLLAAVLAGVTAVVYRRVGTDAVPVGGALLVGAAGIAGLLNLRYVTSGALLADAPLSHPATSAFLLGVFAVGGIAAEGGRRAGDHLAREVFGVQPVAADGEIGELLRAAGLVVAVELPETVGDAEGVPSVDPAVTRAIAGRTMRFPHRLSAEDLASRLKRRIEADHPVGYVDVEVANDGSVEHLAVGARRRGLTGGLPPGTVAVPVRTVPPASASVGDELAVWATDGDESRFVTSGTLHGATGETATLVIDADDADAIDPERSYRVTTASGESDDAADFLSTLQQVDETVTSVAIADGDPLAGEFVGWLPVRVLALRGDEGVVALPADGESVRPGDTLYVLGSPGSLRELANHERDRADDHAGTPPDRPEPVIESDGREPAEREGGDSST